MHRSSIIFVGTFDSLRPECLFCPMCRGIFPRLIIQTCIVVTPTTCYSVNSVHQVIFGHGPHNDGAFDDSTGRTFVAFLFSEHRSQYRYPRGGGLTAIRNERKVCVSCRENDCTWKSYIPLQFTNKWQKRKKNANRITAKRNNSE